MLRGVNWIAGGIALAFVMGGNDLIACRTRLGDNLTRVCDLEEGAEDGYSRYEQCRLWS